MNFSNKTQNSMSPKLDWGNKKELLRIFPEQRDVIEQLAKDIF